MAREVLVAGDGVSGARKGQSVEALPEDREVVVEEILERPVLGRRLVVRRWEPERVVQRRLAGGLNHHLWLHPQFARWRRRCRRI